MKRGRRIKGLGKRKEKRKREDKKRKKRSICLCYCTLTYLDEDNYEEVFYTEEITDNR